MQPGKARAVKFAGFQKLHRAVEIAMRVGHATGQQQRLLDVGLALIAGDPVGERGAVLDDARREMRHHRKAFGVDPFGGGDHVLDRRALDMGDIDAGAFGQQGAEILDLLGGARHHLDRVILEEGLDLTIDGRVGGFLTFAEIQQSHRGLPECTGH